MKKGLKYIRRLEKALRYYADLSNYTNRLPCYGSTDLWLATVNITKELGVRARRALGIKS